jgi:phage FluMu protein Com
MAELFKFRCFQCQKLIGAPPSKFGKVVKCPRCEVELIVPSPEGEEPPPEPEDPDAFRPEEFGIKLETERISQPKPASTGSSVLQPVGPDPIAFLKQVAETPEPESSETPGSTAPEESPNEPNELEVLPELQPEPLVGRGRSRGGVARSEPPPRARDVVLPRTAAVAWSLFGLLGLGFAFISGLLLGHFLWK